MNTYLKNWGVSGNENALCMQHNITVRYHNNNRISAISRACMATALQVSHSSAYAECTQLEIVV